jgi:hypothetical protein
MSQKGPFLKQRNIKGSATLFSFLVLLFLLFQLHTQATGQTVQNNLKLGFVKSYKNFDKGAGDSIWPANTKKSHRVANKAIVLLRADGIGIININGKDVDLKMIKYYLPDRNFKVGKGGYQIWRGKNITLRLDYIFTWLCPPKDEQCEVYYYKGVLDVNYEGRRRKVNITAFGGS